jgi:hypothetical protein
MHKYVLLILCLGLASGCGSPPSGTGSTEELGQTALSDVAELYRIYQTDKKKPPEKLADFAPLQKMSPNGFLALQDRTIIVRYGATMPDTDEGPAKTSSDEILAYQKQVPESGGQVLLLDRRIKKMTPDEFKAAKKAGKD